MFKICFEMVVRLVVGGLGFMLKIQTYIGGVGLRATLVRRDGLGESSERKKVQF